MRRQVELIVEDDGAGLPAGTDLRAISSMGMTLVIGLMRTAQRHNQVRSQQRYEVHDHIPRLIQSASFVSRLSALRSGEFDQTPIC